MSWTKYGNKKVELNGIIYDSKKEANRHQELLMLERAGEISDLERQKKFVLIPAQYEFTAQEKFSHSDLPITFVTDIAKFDFVKSAFKKVKKKCIERECAYIADFVYKENGKTVVEDTKGFRTKDYILKRKMMLHVHGIRIKEL